jgi:hypothetical protein
VERFARTGEREPRAAARPNAMPMNTPNVTPPDLKTRLSGYSVLAGALLAASAPARGAIEYLEVDVTVGLGSAYDIDFDGDGTVDASVAQVFASGTNIIGFYNRSNLFVGYGYPSFSSFVYASALGAGVGVGSVAVPNMYVAPAGPFPFATMNYASNFGAWAPASGPGDTVDAYLGMEFLAGAGTTHFAWIRCKVVSSTEVIVVEYAWETDALVPITTGDTGPMLPPASPATALTASDAGDANDGTDLALSFVKADDETTVQEYRAIAVRTPAAGAFDLAAAEALAADRYVTVVPDGTDPGIDFGAGGLDADGNAITGGNDYTCFVLSVADAATAIGNTLSGPSNNVVLVTFASAAQNVNAEDFANAGDATDMRVRFDPAPDESTVTEYRVMVVDSAGAPTFDLAAAQAVGAGNYTVRVPNGVPADFFLDAGALDVNGLPVAQGEPYAVFVLSVADGTVATEDALAGPSGIVTLRVPSGIDGAALPELQALVDGGTLVLRAPAVSAEGRLTLFGTDGRELARWAYAGGDRRFPLPPNADAAVGVLRWDTPAGSRSVRPAWMP